MAELEVKERQAGDVTILDLSGSVRMGEGAVSLRNAIRSLNRTGKEEDSSQSRWREEYRLEWDRRTDCKLYDDQPRWRTTQTVESYREDSESSGYHQAPNRIRLLRQRSGGLE